MFKNKYISPSWLNFSIKISFVTWLTNTMAIDMSSHSRARTNFLHLCLVSLVIVKVCAM